MVKDTAWLHRAYWFPRVAKWLRRCADWLDPAAPPTALQLLTNQLVFDAELLTRPSLSSKKALSKYKQITVRNLLRGHFPDVKEHDINLAIELAVKTLNAPPIL